MALWGNNPHIKKYYTNPTQDFSNLSFIKLKEKKDAFNNQYLVNISIKKNKSSARKTIIFFSIIFYRTNSTIQILVPDTISSAPLLKHNFANTAIYS